MRSSLFASLLFVALFALTFSALAQETVPPVPAPLPTAPAEPPRMSVDDAINIIKMIGTPAAEERRFPVSLAEAKKAILAQPDAALPKLVAMLNENKDILRLNAVVLLVNIAEEAAKPSPELIDALKRCSKDSSPAIRAVAMNGLSAPTMAMSDTMNVISAALKMDQPLPLRIKALQIIDKNKIVQAVPLLAKHLEDLLPGYKSIVEYKLAHLQVAAPPPPTTEEETVTDENGNVISRPSPAPVAPAAPPGIPIAPEQLPKNELQAFVLSVEALPAVNELHQTGVILETLAKTVTPDVKPFGFMGNPPWKLEDCVTQALDWAKANKDKFAEEPSKPPAAPAPAPAAPAATPPASTAPAAPAPAAPASTPATP